MLDTLAVAHAETGDFDAAVKCAEKALQSADNVLSRELLNEHLESFQAGKPWREMLNPQS